MKYVQSVKNTFLILCILFASPAFAQLEKVTSMLNKVKDALSNAAIVTVTIAVLWVGYKVLFGGQTLRETAPILIGGLLIGAAAQIASMLVG